MVRTMGYDNCCGYGGFGGRRYLTKEEKTDRLKAYEEQLANELQAVKERIQEIQQE